MLSGLVGLMEIASSDWLPGCRLTSTTGPAASEEGNGLNGSVPLTTAELVATMLRPSMRSRIVTVIGKIREVVYRWAPDTE